jgi:hypothetical protein
MTESPRDFRKRATKATFWLFSSMLLLFLLRGYAFDHVRVVRLDNFYDPKYGYPAGIRERYFSREFPSSKAIQDYLANSTLVLSSPPNLNRVYYFDSDHKFISWRADILESGTWWSSPGLQLIQLGKRWRVAIVSKFCTLLSSLPDDAQQDNCYDAETTSSLMSQGLGSTLARKPGDVFTLEGRTKAPFRLPNTPITTESLEASLAQLSSTNH